MKRRVLYLAGLTLVLLAASQIPFVRSGVTGLLRGESFYRGRPTSYWREELKEWKDELPQPTDWFWPLRQVLPDRFLPDAPPVYVLSLFSGRCMMGGELEPNPRLSMFGGDPDAVGVLVELLRDPEAWVRCDAAQALGAVGPGGEAGVPALVVALDDESLEVARNAAWALGEMGPGAKAAVPALTREVGRGRWPVCDTAVDALKKIDPETAGTTAIP
jgi:hypothetical protein